MHDNIYYVNQIESERDKLSIFVENFVSLLLDQWDISESELAEMLVREIGFTDKDVDKYIYRTK